MSNALPFAVEKLSLDESTISQSDESSLFPTLSLSVSSPHGPGNRSLCPRCLSLLSYVITQFGDGTGYEEISILHSTLSELSVTRQAAINEHRGTTGAEKIVTSGSSTKEAPSDSRPCVMCVKVLQLFNAARDHVAFHAEMRTTPLDEWTVTWNINAPDPKVYPHFAFPHDELGILLMSNHRGGYAWGIGGFNIYPDHTTDTGTGVEGLKNQGDYPIITSLKPALEKDGDAVSYTHPRQRGLDFSSILSAGSMALTTSWIHECVTSHPQCRVIFGQTGLDESQDAWFPDRLIYVSRMPSTETLKPGSTDRRLTARVVLKSNPTDYPPEFSALGLKYITLSHSWGPPPDASAPLGGRASTVLTQSNLAAWQVGLPLEELPLTFQQAITVCTSLGFEYIWIDSLCILQDSHADWHDQSAVMGDIYKFAWLNIAALSSTSDYEGFINYSRDPQVEFGFRAPFASILGYGNDPVRNSRGQEVILLRGESKLHWNYSSNLPGSDANNVPLFKRAWVYQERNLARRTIAFAQNSIYWACDGMTRGEQPEWFVGGLESSQLRGFLRSVLDIEATHLVDNSAEPDQQQKRREALLELFRSFDQRWHSYVTSYTLCKLTRATDRLIAVSSIARELANAVFMKKKYLAGLWDMNLLFQLAWITVKGRTTPPRKKLGQEGYVAPSWSWASIEAPAQPRSIFNFDSGLKPLAVVRNAEVKLVTEFEFGAVKAGWLRACGRLNRVTSIEWVASGNGSDQKSISLIDQGTNEELWFASDTVEGIEICESGKGIDRLAWMPLTLRIADHMVECSCLVLMEVEETELIGSEIQQFFKPGEKLFMRLGTGNFGRIRRLIKEDKLLMRLGFYPDSQMHEELAKGFRPNTDGYEDFVLV